MTSEDEYSATDSDSESGDEMLEVCGRDPVDDISMQSSSILPKIACYDRAATCVTDTWKANISIVW